MSTYSFHFFSFLVPPSRPSHCKLDNLTAITAAPGREVSEAGTDVTEVHENGVVIHCQAGFDGGLPQTFLLEVRHNGAELVANQSVNSRPRFKVDGLAPNTIFTLDVYAINAKGRSIPVRLKTRTRKVHADVKYSFSAGNITQIYFPVFKDSNIVAFRPVGMNLNLGRYHM